MSQEPVTVTYSLEEILKQINQKLDNLQKDVTDLKIGQARLEERLSGDIKSLDERLSGDIRSLDERLSGNIKSLDERLSGDIRSLDGKVEGLSKRLDYQEFVNRGVIISLIIAILGGLAKLLGIIGNP